MTPLVNKDSFLFGLGMGMIIPATAYALLLTLYTLLDSMGVFSDVGFAEDFRIRTLALFAICSNLIGIQRVRKSYRHETIRGILFATMILIVVWFFVFGIKIMRD